MLTPNLAGRDARLSPVLGDRVVGYSQIKTSRRRDDMRRGRRLRPDLSGCACRLEDRILLSTVTVTTTSDEFDVPANVTVSTLGSGGADGTISLREALVAATNTSG